MSYMGRTGGVAVLALTLLMAGATAVRAADETPVVVVEEESQWEKFKAGSRVAGEAIAQGTKNTAGKVADGAQRAGSAIAEGSKKAGHAIAEKYDDAKEYVKEKVED